jgi:hypothetical protein
MRKNESPKRTMSPDIQASYDCARWPFPPRLLDCTAWTVIFDIFVHFCHTSAGMSFGLGF